VDSFATWLTSHTAVSNFAVAAALVLVTAASVFVAIRSNRGQARSLRFVQWATLKQIGANLYLHERQLRAHLLEAAEDEASSLLSQEADRIGEVRATVESTIQTLEESLKMPGSRNSASGNKQ
jgi:hypothetical protein